jgi:hypothetical protein
MILACMRGNENEKSSTASLSGELVAADDDSDNENYSPPVEYRPTSARNKMPVLSDISDNSEAEYFSDFSDFSDTSSHSVSSRSHQQYHQYEKETSAYSDSAGMLITSNDRVHSHSPTKARGTSSSTTSSAAAGGQYKSLLPSSDKIEMSNPTASRLHAAASVPYMKLTSKKSQKKLKRAESLTSVYLSTPQVARRPRGRDKTINSTTTTSSQIVNVNGGACHPSCYGITNGFWILGLHCMV